MESVFIFDLDGTLIDSEHRTPRDEDGKLILSEWLALATWENISKDTLLPLSRMFRALKRDNATLTSADRRFLAENALGCQFILSRPEGDNRPDGQMKREMLQEFFLTRWQKHQKLMWDDNPEVRKEVEKIGVVAIDAIEDNNIMAENQINPDNVRN